jgi:lysyl-tRNA synthetase class 2
VRCWFEGEGFLEVETPARVRAPGQEVHLDAFPAGRGGVGAGAGDRWLVTSPEYAMKRLCGAGYAKIVSIGRCWRAEERGPHHQSEFTLIEWYRAGAPLEHLARDCEQLVAVARAAVLAGAWPPGPASGLGPGRPGPPGAEAPPAALAPFARTTVRALFRAALDEELRGDETVAELRALAGRRGVSPGSAGDWDDVFFQLWLDRVEPLLAGLPEPTFVFDWPLPLAALARPSPVDPRLAERFELYAGGLELANAFGELTDAAAQRARFVAESARRRALGKATYPIDEALLTALETMPETAGIALGFDRLMMYVLGATEIRQVVAFADDEI